MAISLPSLIGGSRRKRARIIAIDLGSRTTKAVLLERRGDSFALTRYALLDAPIHDKNISPEQLGDHLRSVTDALETPARNITVAVGLDDAVMRLVDLPQIPLDEMRSILKMGHKNYLQQDLPNHTFDCYIISSRSTTSKTSDGVKPGASSAKLKVLAAAAKQQLIADLMRAAANAGLVADAMVPSLVGPLNAFERAMPEIFNKETVALVDIGFKSSSVSILDRGQLFTNRVINIGGDQITASLAEAKNISYAEAEGIKVGMPDEVESELQTQLIPLGREIRASLDFFEHQQDRPVSQVYLSGGSARSERIVEMLHSEILVECKTWNPTGFLQMALPGPQAVEIDHIAPQLTVAIGTALATY